MLAPGDTVLVAVSGGADSVALLHALQVLGYAVQVAHLNHQLREDESDADEAFVVALAEKLGIPCHCARVDVRAEALEYGTSIEETARNLRYSFFEELALNLGIETVATGHHLDDQAETLLMRVLRGTSLDGLAGIPPLRQDDDLAYIRPLIDCSHAEIVDWMATKKIAWCEDASNTDTVYLRNRVRHELLPQLAADYNPQIARALARTAANLRDDAEVLEELADDTAHALITDDNEIDPEAFGAYPSALQRRVVQRWMWGEEIDLDAERLRAVSRFITESTTGQKHSLATGLSLYRAKDVVQIVEEALPPNEDARLVVDGIVPAFGKFFRVRRRALFDVPSQEDLVAYCSPTRQVLDAATVVDALAVRSRNGGDRFTPLGMDGTRKLQDYFVDRAVPAPARDGVPLVTVGDRIAWVVGHAMDAAFAVTADTQQVIEIEVLDAAE